MKSIFDTRNPFRTEQSREFVVAIINNILWFEESSGEISKDDLYELNMWKQRLFTIDNIRGRQFKNKRNKGLK